jgi:hypothetical protein
MEHREPVHGRHFNIEQQDVWAQQPDEFERLAAAFGLADDLNVLAGRQQLHQPPTSERLVIHNQDAHGPLSEFSFLTFIDRARTIVERRWLFPDAMVG